MPVRRLAAAVLAVTVCLAVSVVAEPAKKPGTDAPSPGDEAFAAATRELMGQMQHNTPTGDTDGDFVRFLVPQQQAAAAMAKAELKYGKDERLKALAKEIVTSEEKAIALMKAWEDKRRGGH